MNDTSPTYNPPVSTPSPRFEPERYRHHLARHGLSRQEEDQLLSAAWDFVEQIIDVGFGPSPSMASRTQNYLYRSDC
ncbi:MAG: hypothetical protein AAF603_08630 [Pseudomonadota bacterium]